MTDTVRIEFLATFPPIQSAIKITGNGDGMRIQFDIPEDQMPQAVKLLAMREMILRVSVEQYGPSGQQQNGTNSTY